MCALLGTKDFLYYYFGHNVGIMDVGDSVDIMDVGDVCHTDNPT